MDNEIINSIKNIDLEVSKRQILMIAYYFPPMGLSGVQRTLKFVKYLPEYNWNPIVLTTGATRYYAFDETLLNDIDENIKIFRTEKDPFNRGKNKKNNKQVKYPSRFKQIIFRILSQSIFIPDSRIRWKSQIIGLLASQPAAPMLFKQCSEHRRNLEEVSVFCEVICRDAPDVGLRRIERASSVTDQFIGPVRVR